MEKQCSKCKVVKSINDFNKRVDTIDGMQYYCRDCSAAGATLWKNNNKFHYNEYQRQRKANNINFRLASNLRSRLRKALLNQVTSKNDTTETLLGITYNEFKEYIEFLMTPDMNCLIFIWTMLDHYLHSI